MSDVSYLDQTAKQLDAREAKQLDDWGVLVSEAPSAIREMPQLMRMLAKNKDCRLVFSAGTVKPLMKGEAVIDISYGNETDGYVSITHLICLDRQDRGESDEEL